VRILTVSNFFESHGGGVEIVAGATARALAHRGHQCRWAAAAFDPVPDDIPVAPLQATDPLERWTGLPLPLPSRSGRRRLEEEVAAADAVIVHDALYVSSILAARYARRHRKPWIHIQHIGAIPYKNPLLRFALASANRLVARPMLESAPRVVFISDAVRSFFSFVRWRRPPQLLLNGVNPIFRLPSREERQRLRATLRMRDDRHNLLFVGRFVEKKGLPALRALAADRPHWDMWMVGGGPIRPGSWNLPNVHPLGRKSSEALAALYKAADCLVLPSVGEGFPLVVQEAMASGLPTFCGADSGAADPGARDFLHVVDVDPSDPVSTARRFAEAIADSAAGPDDQLAAYAHDKYSWDANARWIEEEFLSLQPS
jgi:alpha-maltose-1-phosphate synthase